MLIGGTIILIGGDEGRENEQGQIVTAADKAENAFIELVGHLPTIGLILLISLAADFIAKWVMAQGWFDQHGAAQELGTVRSRIGTEGERPNDGLAAGLGFVGNRLFAAGRGPGSAAAFRVTGQGCLSPWAGGKCGSYGDGGGRREPLVPPVGGRHG